MRVLSLDLKNIGPFETGHLDFVSDEDAIDRPPVTIITGGNGTGKTIVLDAIRGLLGGNSVRLERNIISKGDFELSLRIREKKTEDNITTTHFIPGSGDNFFIVNNGIDSNFYGGHKDTYSNWVVDYWTSKLATDFFSIQNLTVPKLDEYLQNALSGVHQNVEVTQLITYFDYLRSSESPEEQKLGKTLYQKLKDIFKLCLNDGELKYVARKTFEPIVEQSGREITLDKLSSGNLYLVQRMVSMLGKMYAVNVLNNQPLKALCQAPGLLLIDEAENHLHPKWQKTFINNILEIFPNLQIVLTTHSPFIVASVENARIYVCESRIDHSVIVDQTDLYANKPIDEILTTSLFDTQPFNEKISNLIAERKAAISAGNKAQRKSVEQQLKAINPEYFSYFDVEDLLENITAQK